MPVPVPLVLTLCLSLAAAPPAPTPPDPTAVAASTSGDPIADRLAAEAPQPAWVAEGGAAAHTAGVDPTDARRKMRRAARTTVAGGAIAVLGLTAGIVGVVTLSMPKKKLDELEADNGGTLPTDNAQRQRAVVLGQVSPALLGAGLGVFLVGAIVAGVAGKRFKRMHEEQRTSTVAFAPVGMRRGGGFAVGVKF